VERERERETYIDVEVAVESKNGCVYDSGTHSTHIERKANGAMPFPCKEVERVFMLLVQQFFIEHGPAPRDPQRNLRVHLFLHLRALMRQGLVRERVPVLL
jgi:hypothetical protein